jgi:hypothetical protein
MVRVKTVDTYFLSSIEAKAERAKEEEGMQ